MIDYSKSFLNDRDKMQDYLALTKEEFLQSYSYLTEEEYDITTKHYEEVYVNNNVVRGM